MEMKKLFYCIGIASPLIMIWVIAYTAHAIGKNTYWFTTPLALTQAILLVLSIIFAVASFIKWMEE